MPYARLLGGAGVPLQQRQTTALAAELVNRRWSVHDRHRFALAFRSLMLARRRLRLVTLGALAAAAWSAPADAAPVIVVDGDRAQRVEDPFVPPREQTDLGPAPGRSRLNARIAGHGPRAVKRALAQQVRSGAISRTDGSRYRRIYRRARATRARLRGARKRELAYVVESVERLALARRLTPSRMRAAFLQLRRNTAYWAAQLFPANGDQISFRGSELLYEYFPGRGLQLHPLSNFKKANLFISACGTGGSGKPVCGAQPPGPRAGTPCRPKRLRRLLDELSTLAVQRGRGFIAWEYQFAFGGGSPPWMSGMAQATALTALARGARLLEEPKYDEVAEEAVGAFQVPSPLGVKTKGPLGGVHYLQYSFAPRLYIFNAFFQSLIGLHDYGKLTTSARATRLFERGELEARREVPYSDKGNWSRYSFRGATSTAEYHELLREILQGLGRRLGVDGIYCRYAIRYRRYQQRRG